MDLAYIDKLDKAKNGVKILYFDKTFLIGL